MQDVTNRIIEGLTLLASGEEWPQVKDVATEAAAAACTAFDDAALDVAVSYIAAAYAVRAAVYAAAGAAYAAACASLDAVYAAVLVNHEVQGQRNEIRRQAEALLQLIKEAPVKQEKNDDRND